MLTFHSLNMLEVILRIVLALLIGAILGVDRGRQNQPIGLRTYMLVCLGSAVVMMTNQFMYDFYQSGDPARLGAQVISGIGFLGAGSIIVTRRNLVRGLTTAAGLWAAACLGLAVGIGFYEVAILGGVLAYFILAILAKVDRRVKHNTGSMKVYMEVEGEISLTKLSDYLKQSGLVLKEFHLENASIDKDELVSFVISVASPTKEKRMDDLSILDILRNVPGMKYLEEV